MTYQEFIIRNKQIHESLDAIAQRTENMAWIGTANSDNPDFAGLMKAQESLLDEARKILNSIATSSKA